VLAVRQPAARRAGGGGATLAVLLSQEEAEDLAAWRFSGRLVVALAGDLADDASSEVEWRPLFETGSDIEAEPGLSSSDAEEEAIYAEAEYEEPEPAPAPQEPGIEIVSPSGVRVRSVQ
jgi:hypothetical protein